MDSDHNIEKIIGEIHGQGPSPEDVENDPRRKALAGIARMMNEETAPEPPADLGERVMARIRSCRPTPWRALREALLRPCTVSFDPIRALRAPVTGQECSFYFIMVGIFYAVLGTILLAGLHGLGAYPGAPDWVRWQPPIAIVTAGCMVAVGLYLLKDVKSALRAARIWSLVYLGFALLNGVFVTLEWNVPVSAYVSLVSTLIGLPTGFFLIRTIQNCGKRYA